MVQAHHLARHVADYVLVWTGTGGDIGKSKHMAKIATSVHRGHCAESDCDQFGVMRGGEPSATMGASLLWHVSTSDERNDGGAGDRRVRADKESAPRSKRRCCSTLCSGFGAQLWSCREAEPSPL